MKYVLRLKELMGMSTNMKVFQTYISNVRDLALQLSKSK